MIVKADETLGGQGKPSRSRDKGREVRNRIGIREGRGDGCAAN